MGALAHAERVVAGELLGPGPVLARPRGLQMRIEPIQRLHQCRRAKCLLCQGIQLGPLVRAQAVAETLCGGGALGQ